MASDSADEPTTSESGELACSRRAFLAGAATIAGGALATQPAVGQSRARDDDWPEEFVVNPSDDASRFGQPGKISREGTRLLAETDYQAQKKGNVPTFKKHVHAVKDLGLDPTGGEPVQNKIASAAAPGTAIIFPPGEYRVTGNLVAGVDGPFGIMGEGYKDSKRPPGPNDKDAVIFKIDNSKPTVVNFRTPSGFFANFALDQRGAKQQVGLHFETDGIIYGKDIRTIGPQSSAYPQSAGVPALASITASSGTVRIQRYVNVGGGKAGTKESSGVPIVWAGSSHHGTAQFIDFRVENSADNGLYGGRTPGNVQVFGGLWRNNEVSQVRVNGKGSRVDGATVIIDEKNYKGLGNKNGWPSVNGIKWDGKVSADYGPSGGKIVNCDVRGLSVAPNGEIGSLIAVFGTAGAATIKNTRLVNKIPEPTPIFAQSPAGGVPQPHRILVKNSLIGGKIEGNAVVITGRPRSLVSKTCLKYSGAGPSDIQGAGTSGVGYGKQCGDAGLSNPKKVGGGGPLPPLPSPGGGGPNGPGGGEDRKQRQKAIFTVVISGIFMLLLMFGMFVVFVVGGMVLLGGLVALLGGN